MSVFMQNNDDDKKNHNDSCNCSSENAAKCQAFSKQQFRRGNEDTLCVCVCVEAGAWQKGY